MLNDQKTLQSIALGGRAVVKKINSTNSSLRHRLLSLGLTEGREIEVTRRAPFGGTIGIELIGFSLALRLTEADAVAILV